MGKRPPPLSSKERERRRGGFSPLDRLGGPVHAVTMTVVMDDVPAGTASEAVNGGRPSGDCLQAAVATVLGMSLGDVPHFAQYVEHPEGTDCWLWWWALVGFCHASGWQADYCPDEAPRGWALADGMSPRGHNHVVVAFNGEIVFDPHPSRAGLASVTGWIGLRREGDDG